jgi:hypothetical protein
VPRARSRASIDQPLDTVEQALQDQEQTATVEPLADERGGATGTTADLEQALAWLDGERPAPSSLAMSFAASRGLGSAY